MPTDAELLRRYAADRSETAFAELVRRHLDGVYSSAVRRVGFDTHLAQDVAQAVFIALARQSRALADHPFLCAWLYTTTRNEAATTVRRERRRKTREAVASAMNETNTSSSAESTADWSRLSPVLDDTIDQLSEPDRAAILLRFIAQKPFAEIGTQLRVSEDAARMRVDRALDKLRPLLAKRGLTSTSAALSLVLASNVVAATPTAVVSSVMLSSLATLPVAAAANAAVTAKLATNAALSAKAWLSISALTAASLGYFVFAHTATEAPPPTPAVISATSKISQRTWPAEEAAVRAFLERHPEVQDALHAYYHARFKTDYGHIYRELHLNREEITKIQSLLCEGKFYTFQETPGIDLPVGSGLSESEANALIDSILGPERVPTWNVRITDPMARRGREWVEDVATNLAFSDYQLTPSQTARLLSLFYRVSRSADWDRLTEEARHFLSPRQREALVVVRSERDYGETMRPYWNESFRKTTEVGQDRSAVSETFQSGSHRDDPKVLAAWRTKQHASLATDYAPFYERTRLSPDQRVAFEKILIQRTLTTLQDHTARLSYPAANTALKSLLGESCFQTLRTFEPNKLSYKRAATFAAHATFANQSLTPAQADKLAQLLIANTRKQESPWRTFIDWKNVEIRAADFLSSEQLELLKTTEQSKSPRFLSLLHESIRDALEKDRLAGIPPPVSNR